MKESQAYGFVIKRALFVLDPICFFYELSKLNGNYFFLEVLFHSFSNCLNFLIVFKDLLIFSSFSIINRYVLGRVKLELQQYNTET